jgi:hypothetical protein
MLWFERFGWCCKSSDACYWLYDGVSTSELDNLAAETAASIVHPDYAQLAACDLKFTLEY